MRGGRSPTKQSPCIRRLLELWEIASPPKNKSGGSQRHAGKDGVRMEVRTGYKQTEVGVIPEDWEVKPIKSLNFDISDGNYSSKYPKASDFRAFGVPFIRANNIKGLKVIDDDLRYISEEQHAELLSGHLKKNDILITTRGDIGQIAFVPERHIDSNINAQLVRINVDKTKNSHRFVGYVLTFGIVQKQFESLQTGSALKQLPIGKLVTLNIPLPPTFAEQEAIAEALSDADALIESLEALLAKKRHVKQGAMSELLKPNRNWVEKKLGQTAVLKARIGWQGLTTKEYLDSGDYFLITGTEFSNGYIDWESCHYVNESRYKQDRNIQVRQHDVLVTKDGTIGKVALITDLPKPATLNSGVFVIRPIEESFVPEFFYYLLCSSLFTEFLGQLSAGSTINHLYQKDFVNFVYKTPPTLEEQTVIAEILSDMDAEIRAVEGKLSKARAIKAGMMSALLSGRIRLVVESGEWRVENE